LIAELPVTLPVKKSFKQLKLSDSAMVLPIVAYGSPILRTVSKDIFPGHANLQKLIEDM
jgi:hypothetical protein